MKNDTYFKFLSVGLILLAVSIIYVFNFKMQALADQMADRVFIEFREMQQRSCEIDNLIEECGFIYGE